MLEGRGNRQFIHQVADLQAFVVEAFGIVLDFFAKGFDQRIFQAEEKCAGFPRRIPFPGPGDRQGLQ